MPSFIAISGLGGHPFGSFKERDGEHMWLRDALPHHITEEDDDTTPMSRVMVYGYSSNLFQSDSFQNLEDLGTAFHRHLRTLAIAGKFKPIVFIAHSLGGLIVKQVFALRIFIENLCSHYNRLLFPSLSLSTRKTDNCCERCMESPFLASRTMAWTSARSFLWFKMDRIDFYWSLLDSSALKSLLHNIVNSWRP